MENGTFSINKKIFNLIIKYSKDNELSKLLLDEMSSKTVKQYIKDIRKCDVKTADIFFEFKYKNRNIMLENYISGKTVDQILKENSDLKFIVIRKYFKLYKKIKSNDNLCLDWNFKNFIYHNGELYYIDFVPCLYKDKLMLSNSVILKEFISSFLDENLIISRMYYYILKTLMIVMPKKELINFYGQLNNICQEELGKTIMFDYNHPYINGIKIIFEYMYTDLSLDGLKNMLDEISMEEKINENIKKKYVKYN